MCEGKFPQWNSDSKKKKRGETPPSHRVPKTNRTFGLDMHLTGQSFSTSRIDIGQVVLQCIDWNFLDGNIRCTLTCSYVFLPDKSYKVCNVLVNVYLMNKKRTNCRLWFSCAGSTMMETMERRAERSRQRSLYRIMATDLHLQLHTCLRMFIYS